MTRRFERYVALGDSSTEGLDDPDGRGGYRGWADRLAEHVAAAHPGLLYANLAVRGKLIGQIINEQLDAAVALPLGAELGRRILAEPALRSTRLILLTSSGQRGDGHLFAAMGFAGYLLKPIGQRDLLDSVALVMAREWERGTLEALFVTPVRSGEVLVSKIVPYFGVGLVGLTLCLLAARFLFEVPIRG